MAKLFLKAGLITMVAFISLFRAERQMAREGGPAPPIARPSFKNATVTKVPALIM
jgi:Adenylylsulphate kinase